MMKLGRVGKVTLNKLMETTRRILNKDPMQSVALIIAPVLCSSRTPGGKKGEYRRVASR